MLLLPFAPTPFLRDLAMSEPREPHLDQMQIATRADLHRIDQQISRLADAVERLVRVEERQAAMSTRMESLEDTVTDVATKASATEERVTRWVQRSIGAWAVISFLLAVTSLTFVQKQLAFILLEMSTK